MNGHPQFLRSSVRILIQNAAACCLCLLWAVHEGGAVCNAQSEETARSAQLNTDRRVANRINLLRTHLASRQFGDVRNELQRLQAADPSMLVPDDGGVHQPVFRAQMRLLQGSDQEFLQQLRMEQQPAADATLQSAIAEGQITSLLNVILQFPCSDAAYVAHQLIARRHIERGNTRAAIWWLQPVAHRSAPPRFRDRAQRILDRLTTKSSLSSVSATDSSVQAGAATTAGATPPYRQWSYPVATSPELNLAIQRLVEGAVAANVVPWTVWQPVQQGQHLLIRTLRGLDCLDVATGRAVWNYRCVDLQFQNLEVPQRLLAGDAVAPEIAFRTMDVSTITDRMLRDAVHGGLASDRQRVYLLNPTESRQTSAPNARRVGSGLRFTPAVNELLALDGKDAARYGSWVDLPWNQRLATSWPTPGFVACRQSPGGRLFCVVEQDDAISMVCLDASNGQLLWRRFLVYPRTPIDQDRIRRLLTATPTVIDGIAWSQTTTGWTFAIDTLNQLTLWAARTSDSEAESDNSPIPSRRSSHTRARPLAESWRPLPLQLSGNALVVCPQLQHHFTVLDAITGQLRMRRESSRNVLLLHVDSARDSAILGGPVGIEACSLQTGVTRWTTRLPDGRFPTGMAAVVEDALIVPVSDGRLATIALDTGAVKELSEEPWMETPCGGVLSVGNNLLTYGPIGVQLLGPELSGEAAPTLDSVSRLMAADQHRDALGQLDQIPETAFNRNEIRALRFRCLAGIAPPGDAISDEQLAELRLLSESAEEAAIIRQLEISQLQRQGQQSAAADLILQTTQMSESILNALIPARLSPGADQQNSSTTGELKFEVAFRLWLRLQLQSLLADNAETETQVRQFCASFSDEQFLTLTGSLFPEDLLARAKARISSHQLDGVTAQLISSAAASPQRDSDVTGDVSVRQAAAKILAAGTSAVDEAEQTPTLASAFFETFTSELTHDPWDSVNVSESEPQLLRPDRRQLLQEWDRWATLKFRMVPVSQSTTFRRGNPPLEVVDAEDPFLSRFQWRLHRSVPMLMVRDPAGNLESPSIIPGGNADTFQGEAGRESLLRIGDIVLAYSPITVTAMSVVDQRVLWSRRFAATLSGSVPYISRSFRMFRSFSRQYRRPLSYISRGFRICGFNAHSVCIQSTSGVEVLDLHTGQVNWRISGPLPPDPVFATTSSVLFNIPWADGRLSVGMSDAQPAAGNLTSETLNSIVLAHGDELIVWRSRASADADVELDWVDARTQELIRTIPLTEATAFQFIDRYTLAAVAADQSFQIVDLRTAEHHQHSFANPQQAPDSEVTEPPSEEQDAGPTSPALPPGMRRPQDFARWSPERVLIFRDALNYYVVNRRDAASPQLPLLPGNSLTEVEGELRAINRETGEFSWSTPIDDVAAVTFDQPLQPMLMLVSVKRPDQAIPRPAALHGLTIRAVAKATGATAFEHRTSSRHSIPVLQFDTAADGTVDVEPSAVECGLFRSSGVIPAQIIASKRDGHPLSDAEVTYFISRYAADEIPDYQMAALAMAIFLNA